MKKILFTLSVLLLLAAGLYGQGSGPQVVILNVNGGGNTYYKVNTQDWGDNALTTDLNEVVSLSGQDFGTPTSLVLDGAITVHWGSSQNQNILNYRVYKVGAAAPAFTTVAIDFPIGNCCENNYKFDKTGLDVDLLALAINGDGTYVFEAGISFNGSVVATGYIANFTVGTPTVTYPVTLRVEDYSQGDLTQGTGWTVDGNIYIRASDNLKGINPGFHDNGQFYGLFNGTVNWYGTNINFPNGLLVKGQDKWTWQATLNVVANETYYWFPININTGWNAMSDTLRFSTDEYGNITGDTLLNLGLAGKKNITFRVDMNDQTVGNGVYITGTFCSWAEPGNSGSITLTDGDGDGVYEGSLLVTGSPTPIQYKFFNGSGWSGGEAGIAECFVSTNRVVIVDENDTILPVVKFNECYVPPLVPEVSQTFYVDFGLPTYLTANPDLNGNYWNNVSFANSTAMENMIAPLALINSGNGSTPYTLQITQKFNSNNAGGLATPNADLLDDLAIANATLDYVFNEGATGRTSAFVLRHLDPQKAYQFSLFGTRSATDTRVDSFLIVGLNVSGGSQQTSGTGIGSAGGNGNDNNIFVSDLVYPDADSTIKIEIGRKVSQYAALSAMKVQEWANVPEPNFTLTKKLYFDFGDLTTATTNPDANGNSWNNIAFDCGSSTIAPTGTFSDLIDRDGVTTPYSLEIVTAFQINNNSPGGLATPNPDLLGDMAIATAAQDYFFDDNAAGGGSKIKITGLFATKGYKFYVFGSRIDAAVRLANMIFTGATTFSGIYQTTGTGVGATAAGGTTVTANTTSLYVTPVMFPDANGEISFEMSVNSGNFYHLNAMRMEEYSYEGFIAPESISLSCATNPIINTGVTVQIEANILPTGAAEIPIQWSVVSGDSAAWVDNNGVVHPVGNGTVTVMGRIAFDNIDISNTIQITILNQVKELYLFGSACENGDGLANAIPMHLLTDKKNSATNQFELYTRLGNGTFKFYTGVDTYGDGCGPNCIVIEGSDIVSTWDTTVLITVNLTTNTYTVVPVQWGLTGNVFDGYSDWGVSSYPTLDYVGAGVWQKVIKFKDRDNTSDHSRFDFVAKNSWDWIFKGIKGTNTVARSNASYLALTELASGDLEDINTNFDSATLLITLDLWNYTYSLDCLEEKENKITVIGSSTPRGTGATNSYGYTQQYGTLLNERYAGGQSTNDWLLSNVCINGNYTGSIWNRWKYDLINNCAKYVIIGLTFGNEKDNVSPDTAAFISYRDNLRLMVDSLRSLGKVPVLGTPYMRADFTSSDYNYVKELNLIISKWDVPSTNLLGTVDDGTGKFVTGYWSGDIATDKWHPNDAGHREFFHAMVPSLFDALEAGKPDPVRNTSTSYPMTPTSAEIGFTPEDTVHSFTVSFAFKTAENGVLAAIEDTFRIVGGMPQYGATATGASTVNDDSWYRLTLTHYYARKYTEFYLDSTLISGFNDTINLAKFSLGGGEAEFRELFFYRSSMTSDEIKAICRGEMLRSSLEIYAPLGEAGEPFKNYAQSLNEMWINLPAITKDELNYTLPRTETYNGQPVTVEVTGKNANVGDITVKYNGTTTEPVNAGKYEITVDITATPYYAAAHNLLLDTLTIAKAKADTSLLDYVFPANDTVIFDGYTHPVAVTPAEGITGLGDISVTYNDLATVPSQIGTYVVKAVLAEGDNYLDTTLVLGSFVIKSPVDSIELTKNDLNYNLPRTEPYTGQPILVDVTSKVADAGAITVKYNGSTTAPTDMGKYGISVDIASHNLYKAINDLQLDTLTIGKARVSLSDLNYTLTDSILYDGLAHPVAVTGLAGMGDIHVLYNGDTAAPIALGSYIVRARIDEGTIYDDTLITIGTMVIYRNIIYYPVTIKVIDQSKGVITNRINDQNEVNLFIWASDNLSAQNPRNPSDWWYPLYNDADVTPTGLLTKTETAWEWTITLVADTGTYKWKPYAKNIGWQPISPTMYEFTGDDASGNLIFSVGVGGEITGHYELVIPDPNPEPEPDTTRYDVTLQVIDMTAGLLTDAPNTWAYDANIVTYVSGDLNDGGYGFYGMFDRTVDWDGTGTNFVTFPRGQLIKSDSSWTWQATFRALAGTYDWNPMSILLNYTTLNNNVGDAEWEGENMHFSIDSTGNISGDTRLVINRKGVSVEISSKADFTVSPNPASTNINIYDSRKGNLTYRLYDMQGVLVLETNKKVIDLSSLRSSIYFLHSGGKVLKIVKK